MSVDVVSDATKSEDEGDGSEGDDLESDLDPIDDQRHIESNMSWRGRFRAYAAYHVLIDRLDS
jgi:hypothetical protein